MVEKVLEMDVDSPQQLTFPKRRRTGLTSPNINNDIDSAHDAEHASVAVVSDVTSLRDVPKWQEATEAALAGIVAVRASQPISFDTDYVTCFNATGFIIDAERGIILTNRHVVGAGPFVGEAIMYDHEEVEVRGIYRDPIHDFGFLQFDPKRVKYMKMVEIPLAPEEARVGIDVRIIGNDAGEKLSILAGSISRIDRNAPDYGTYTYNDFNTFYIQSASNLSGGSSGSPVIDIHGNAVALQAGGRTNEATNFFLPLDRVKRAYEFIKEGKSVPRGTVQMKFTYSPFDDVRRLGLPEEIEAMVRRVRPGGIGMLVAVTVLPNGPGSVAGLEEGDILISINGKIVTHFVTLEEILDDNVGNTLRLVVNRGGTDIEVDVAVEDMHEITPSRMVTYGDTIVNNLSYQLANSFNRPVCGIYAAFAGTLLSPFSDNVGILIDSIDSKPVNNVDEFVDVIKAIPDRSYVNVVFYYIHDKSAKHTVLTQILRQWNSLRIYTRNDKTGLWDCKKIPDYPKPCDITPTDVKFPTMEGDVPKGVADLVRSIVRVRCYMPIATEGNYDGEWSSYGVVVDAEKGLVIVSRRTVQVSLCELSLIVADSVFIPAKLLFLHPTHNIAIIQYDPKHLGATDIYAAPLSEKPLKQGDETRMVTQSRFGGPVCIKTVVSGVAPASIRESTEPRWRCINTEVIHLESQSVKSHGFGLLSDEKGNVQGLYMSCMKEDNKDMKIAINVCDIMPAVAPLQKGMSPALRCLNVEVEARPFIAARVAGLSDERLQELQQGMSSTALVFRIKKVENLSTAYKVLNELDYIISINGKLMRELSDLNIQYTQQNLEIVVLRDKKEITLQVDTMDYDKGVNKIVSWSGATFQAPHKAVLQQTRVVPSGVYCTNVANGSPACQYSLESCNWITHVNGEKITDIDSFERAVRACADGTYVRIKTDVFEIRKVYSVKTCYHYWPTQTLVRDDSMPSGWRNADKSK
ncbi:hypothetical protein IW140_001485 [Coemansia sp. RSA 1813]|nr:hypothetical protein EV178_003277 [Coemansia sp. RSA 1646]KAJ1771557.1 hypothetical protein LPJ74_002245 [Coemansia sp. RSA 1843]KAJ2089583.1 hypothetical protein IW138_003325 [Coemansia sp. RSA 986]KAJ2214685.1 hypothetical protein EV179_002790 [Coemansia sp. RSA 487]KAJ2571567.1 hypothetical protein IW140_001485 [Coemansia sp. RSA 1813]